MSWSFRKDGTIGNGAESVSFIDLVKAINATSAVIEEVDLLKIGETLLDNDLVYLKQSNGKYYKAKQILGTPNEKQNAIGVYKIYNEKHYVIYQGILKDFNTNLVPGVSYYLSSVSGSITSDILYNKIKIGKALTPSTILINISGDVDIPGDGIFVPVETTLVDGQTKVGNSFIDLTKRMTAHFLSKEYSDAVATTDMYFKLGELDGLLKIRNEYIGAEFTITVDNSVYSGVFTEALDINNPYIMTLVSGDPIVKIPVYDFDTSITNGQTVEGITLTDPAGTMTMQYDKVVYDISIPALIMFFSVNGVVGKLDFASEYTGKDYIIIVGTDVYIGVFAENNDFTLPVILNKL